MAILEKEVWVTLSPRNISHFEQLGYKMPRRLAENGKHSVPRSSKILVKTKDLPNRSTVRVTKICDYCKVRIESQCYYAIIEGRRKISSSKDTCLNCSRKLAGERFMDKPVPYEKSLKFYALVNNKRYLLEEYISKNNKDTSLIYKDSGRKCLWKCPECGSEYSMSPTHRTSYKCGCPYCAGVKVNEINSFSSKYPDLASLLLDKSLGEKVTTGSGKSLSFVCPDCGKVEKKRVVDIINRGFTCNKCGDKMSYPEKFILNLLEQLSINYIKEKVFDWSKNISHHDVRIRGTKRYDFYLPHYNAIIEVHGQQHYSKGFDSFGGRSSLEEKINDELKEKIAKENDINHYIVINAEKSSLNYLKKSVMKSPVKDLANLENVNWELCHEFGCKSITKDICNFWNEKKSTIETSEKFKLSKTTVRSHLKKGKLLGWTDYDPKQQMSVNGMASSERNGKKIVQLSMNEGFIKEWGSIKIASSNLKVNSSNITSVCKGRTKSAGGYKWMYKEDYDKYIEEKNNIEFHNDK